MTRGRAIRVPVADGWLEVATGEDGRGVFLALTTPAGRRRQVVSVGEDGAERLARTLRLAAAASVRNRGLAS